MNYAKKLIKWKKRSERVVLLREKGYTFSEIAQNLGMTSRQQAQAIYKRTKK